MEHLKRKTLTTEANITYKYYIAAAEKPNPTLLLLHGCPDVASLWADLIETHLRPAGYGIIAPDLIGYGDTDKPTALEAYAQQNICKDLVGILDHESLATVLVVGHDFGAFTASRMCCFHPSRIAGLITLGTAYVPPSPFPFDFEQVKTFQEQDQGYCSSWYFPLFTSPTGAQLIDAHLANMFTALHGGGARMKAVLCVEGGIEKWLGGMNDDASDAEVLPYATAPGFREEWISRLHRDGWTAPLNWYKAVVASLSLDAEKAALAAGQHVVNAPYLFVAARQDPLARPEAVQVPVAYGMLPDLTVEELDAGHWCMLEKPVEVGRVVIDWLEGNFKGGVQMREGVKELHAGSDVS